ncbi:MAG TPA: hypothetical protein VFI47_24460 [Acidimicrobiales bacterium]|nr:hypothetical protein [Acidimicrobiales bacterium]
MRLSRSERPAPHRRPVPGLRPSLALMSLAALAALAWPACGGDDSVSTGDEPPASTTTAPDAGDRTDPPAGGDAVIEIRDEGGFVSPQQQFAMPPRLVITGDGRLVQGGVTTAIFPGPLVPPLTQRTISDEGVAHLLDLAEEKGLLANVDYARPGNIMDAPDTVVAITAGGTTYEHRAYALGLAGDGTEDDPARAALAEFVSEAEAFAVSGDAALGGEEPYVADAYLVRASTVDPNESQGGVSPTVVDWPAEMPVRLADAEECAEVPAAVLAPLVEDANQLTFFAEGGTTYAVSVMPRIAGRTC